MSQFDKYVKIAKEMINEAKMKGSKASKEKVDNKDNKIPSKKEDVVDFIENNKENLYFSALKSDSSGHGGGMIYISNKKLNNSKFEGRQLKSKKVISELKNNIESISKNKDSNYSGGNEFIITLSDVVNFGFNDTEAEDFILVA
jgi:hypothetical protein